MSPLHRFAVVSAWLAASLAASATNLQFSQPDSVKGLRSRESFDSDWKFARFGLQADGSRKTEPGASTWAIDVTASSEEGGNLAGNAFDNNNDTRWCADGPDANQWLQLDFGQATALTEVKLVWEKEGNYTAVIEGSDDAKSWKAITPGKDQPASQRYLRIRTTALPPKAWASIREVILLDDKGQPVVQSKKSTGETAPSDPKFDDASWRKLDLPHDWGIEGPFRQELSGGTGKLPWKGIGWYRKNFTLPAADNGKCVFLDFDGAMAYAKVWINGHQVGDRPFGYSAFQVDLTPYLNHGGENTIAVRVDTESWDSRWYPGAGIYRHTWLLKTGADFIEHYGVTITTPQVGPDSATVTVVVRSLVVSGDPSVEVAVHELNADDTVGPLVVKSEPVEGTPTTVNLKLKPKLWSIEAPHRYLARAVLKINGEPADVVDTPFGIRTLNFSREGFKLNGKRVQVYGVCNHHDLGALGAAINNRALERQLQILKEMGCNALRTTHNPPAPELLDLADKMGFLVQVEAFDCWEHGKVPKDYNRLWKRWHQTDLTDMVRQDRNHPSVFMWSIGNEVREQDQPKYPKELTEIIRYEDKTRPVTAGCHNPQKAAQSGFIGEIDSMGVNYHLEFYDGFLKDPRYKDKSVYSSESSSCVSSRGEYFFPVKRGRDSQVNFQVSSYDVDAPGWAYPPDDQFKMLAKHPEFFGEFVWTGFDYLGEPTPYDGDAANLLNFSGDPEKRAALEKELKELGKLRVPSRSSYFGILDLAGFPKDRYYMYLSKWRPEVKTAHILPHWNWPERVGQVTPVHVYTSGDEAELFLNGKSLGRKKMTAEDSRLRWDDVVYEPGELRVISYKNGKEWAKDSVKTTDNAAKLALSADRNEITADGKDLSFITLRVQDSNDLLVPRTHPQIHFTVEGPGEIIATDNGDATSFESFQSPDRLAYNGMALVIVRGVPGKAGAIHVKAASDGLAAAEVEVTSK